MQTPAPVTDFTGRASELDRLRRLFTRTGSDGQPALRVAAVSGAGGVGKTAFVHRVACQLRDEFPDGQLYADLFGQGDRPVPPVQVLVRFLSALGLDSSRLPREESDCAGTLRSLLANRKMLIILDNARDAAQVRPLLPGPGGCRVLITSRRRMIDLEGAFLLDLDVLPTDDALELLSRVARRAEMATDSRAAREVVAACGRLPIAVRIAGARLASRPTWSVAVLGQRLRDQRRRLDELRVGDLQVRATFQLSYEQLVPATARAFRLLAIAPAPQLSMAAAAALLGLSPGEAECELGNLVNASLLEMDRSGRFRLHDLLRLYGADLAAAEEPPEELAAATERLLDWYLTRTAAAAQLQHPNMVRLPLPDRFAPAPEESGPPTPPVFATYDEGLDWLDAELTGLVATIEHVAEHGPGHLAWQLADQLRGYFFSRRSPALWLASGRAGLAAARRAGDLRAQAAMHQTLGQAHWSVGDFERSLADYRQGLDLARRSGWQPAVAYLLHNLGLVQLALGQPDEAQRSYLAALRVCAQHQLDYVQAVTLNDLGMLCWELGQLSEAAEYLTEALELNRRGGNEDGQGVNLCNLGIVLRDMGSFAEARSRQEQCLRIYRRTGSRYGILGALDELSQVHTWEGNHDRAVVLAEQALATAYEVKDRTYQAGVLATLGNALLGAGRRAEAADRLAEAYQLARAVAAPYLQTRALTGLAAAEPEHRLVDALAHARAAVHLARSGGYRILEADALLVMAELHLADGDRGAAVACGDESLAICVASGSRARVARVRRLLDPLRPARRAEDAGVG